MTLWDPPDGGALSDSELDAILARADEELLDHVRAHTHPDRALLAMMAGSDVDAVAPMTAEATVSSAAVVHVPSDHAVTVIAMRTRTRDIDHGLGQLLIHAEALEGFGDAAAQLEYAVTDARAIGRSAKVKRDPPRRWRQMRWIALLIVLLDGAIGYAAVATLGGSVPLALLGAVCSTIILVALQLTLAINWARLGRLAVSLLLRLGAYIGSALTSRRLTISAEPGSVTTAGMTALRGSASLLALASSYVLRWCGEDHSRSVTIHEIAATIGICPGRVGFARLTYLAKTPISRLADSAERIDAHYEFHLELSAIRSWVFELADNAECTAGGDSEIRALSSALARTVDELSESLAAFDRALALVRSLLHDVMPRYLEISRQRQLRVGRRRRREIAANIADLASAAATVGEKVTCAVEDLSSAKGLNPIRQLAAVEIDASGADLSTADVRDLELLEGVIWTDETTWPPGTTERIRAHSDEIRSGVYRVRRGNERNPSFATV